MRTPAFKWIRSLPLRSPELDAAHAQGAALETFENAACGFARLHRTRSVKHGVVTVEIVNGFGTCLCADAGHALVNQWADTESTAAGLGALDPARSENA